MKIIELIFDLSSGGAERFVVDLSNELAKSNDVSLLTIKDDSVNPEKRRFYLPELDSRVKYVNIGIPDGRGFSIDTFVRIHKAICAEKADVLHIHTNPIVNFCLPSLFLLCNRMVIVQTLHTDFKVGHSSNVYKFLFNTLGRWHKMRWVALSGPNYQDMMAAYPFLLGQCIRNGRSSMKPTASFDDVRAEVDALRSTAHSRVFIHIARCIEVKNQMMLVRAFNKFVEKGADAELLIIGAGFDSELGLRIQAEACGHIHFLGTRKNVADYLLNADSFCISSLYEGLPITVLESIMSGIPIVSTPLAGVHDVVVENYNAIFSSDFELESYCASLLKAYDSIDVIKDNAEKEMKKDKYCMKTCAGKYLDLFCQKKNKRIIYK